jgi:hypothetical protein
MKRIFSIGAMVFIFLAMLAMAGCVFILGEPGADGKAYVQVQCDESNYGLLGAIEGFPNGWYTYTDYQLGPGSYDGAYVLFWYTFDGATYDVYFNDTVGMQYLNFPSVSTALSTYLSNDFSNNANGITFTISINPGEDGALFTDGADGADKYYTLWLAWNPANSFQDPYPSIVPGPKTKILESSADRVVQELTQGKYTMRFTVTKGGGAAADLPAPQVFLPKGASK